MKQYYFKTCWPTSVFILNTALAARAFAVASPYGLWEEPPFFFCFTFGMVLGTGFAGD